MSQTLFKTNFSNMFASVSGMSSYAQTIEMIEENCKPFAGIQYASQPSLIARSMRLYYDNFKMLGDYARDILFGSSLTALSMCFPKVRIHYGHGTYSINFSSIFGAPSSSNKSVMKYSLMLLEMINAYLRDHYREALREWEIDNMAWEKEKKDAIKEGRKVNLDLDPGEKPLCVSLTVPATISKAMLQDLLKGNEMNGCLIDSTEISSFTDSNSKDYGNLMDLINKATMNEKIEKAFRVDGDILKILYPMLSLLMSGTLDQLHKLITSYESGLGSRLPVYLSPDLNEFVSQKPVEGAPDYNKYYSELGKEVFEMWEFFNCFYFSVTFTDEQWDKHYEIWKERFDDVKMTQREMISVSTRFGMLQMRIAATLTMLRLWDEVKKDKETYRSMYVMGNDHPIECNDLDFETSRIIATTLFEHTMMFSTTKVKRLSPDVKEMSQWRWQYEVLKVMNDEFTIDDFCKVAKEEPFKKSKQTCYRVVQSMSKGKGKLIKKLKDKKVDGKCIYQKIVKDNN